MIGYLQVLNGTTNQAIIDFYHERYVPNNQIFVVVGDVKTREVLERGGPAMGGHAPRPRDRSCALPEEPEQLAPRQAVREMEGTIYDTVLAWPTVTLSDRDMYALDLAAYILGEGRKLAAGAAVEIRPAAGAVASPRSARRRTSSAATSPSTASCLPETWQPATEAILGEVYRLRDEVVDEAELAKAKKQKAVEWLFDRQTVQQAAESLGHGFLAAQRSALRPTYTRTIQKVTAEEVRGAARRWFVPERLNRVIIAPPGGGPKAAAEAAAAGSGKGHAGATCPTGCACSSSGTPTCRW